MLPIVVLDDEVRVGERFAVTFQRTLRIPEDGQTYPLPPGLGRLPVLRVEDFAERVPADWRERGGVFIPLYQREALWLGFNGESWKPNAVQVCVGGINAVSGTPCDESLTAEPQNYVVTPDQMWLDGINAGRGFIRQFIAMPLGAGYTVEAQLTGQEESGGIQLRVFEPKPGRFPDKPPPPLSADSIFMQRGASPQAAGAMGLGAGGMIEQKIYPDPYGLDAWDAQNYGTLLVHIVNSERYFELTGLRPPRSPVEAQTYTDNGLPWFDLYEEDRDAVKASERLAGVKTIRQQDHEKGMHISSDKPLRIPAKQVKKLRRARPKRP